MTLTQTKPRFGSLILFACLFFISGAAGLIYEIVWERLLELHFGVTMIAVTLIVAAYMAGLGFGSMLGGRIAHGAKNPWRLYGLLELGIAAFGIFSPSLINVIGQRTAGSPYGLVFILSFGILLVPTTLMGMTLPVLTQSFVIRAETSGRVIGILYGINTLGAAFGSALAGYVLIGKYGFDGAIYAAVTANALVGLLAVAIAYNPKPSTVKDDREPQGNRSVRWGYKTILSSSFLIGFLGLGFEILWIRILHIVNKNTAYSFPSILCVFLVGLAIGGYIFGRKADEAFDPVSLFCKVELAGATLAVFIFITFWQALDFDPPWIQTFIETKQPLAPFVKSGGELLFSRLLLMRNLWAYFLPILILVLPPSLVLGGGLPILDRIAIHSPQVAGRRVGDVHLANIAGSVAGTLSCSFLLLPGIGSELTLKLLAGMTLVFPCLYLLQHSKNARAKDKERPLLGITSALLLLGIFASPGRGAFYNSLYSAGTGHRVVISESGDSVLALTFEDNARERGLFWIGGEINSFFPPSGVYESRAMTCAGAAQPRRILVIGFGGGYSSLFYRTNPEVEEIVIVELLEDVGPFLRENQQSVRFTLDDPRVTFIVDDGRRFLNAFPDEKFDLISIDPLREHTAGHNNLYSVEALRLYQKHLTSRGVLCAWMSEFHVVPHTAARVFPYVDQFANQFLVASNTPIQYDLEYMLKVANHHNVAVKDLFGDGFKGPSNPAYIKTAFLRDQRQILEEERDTPLLIDLKPWLEYYFLVPRIDRTIKPSAEGLAEFLLRVK